MSTETIHRAYSDDGTEIAGRVHGQGPALVLVHGQADDGELDWAGLLPYLTDRFTCYVPSTRGRGLSGEHPDLSPERRLEDITAFVDSIGEPVALLGTSHGGMLALGAAARSSAVAAAVAYEPPAPEALSEEEAQLFEEPTDAMVRAVTEGRMTDAMRSFVEFVVNDDELAAFHAVDYVGTTAKYAPILLEELQLDAQPGAFSPTAPSVLAEITAPVLLLYGTRTPLRWFTDAVHHVADHVTGADVRELTGAGHAAPILQPEAIADEVIRFLASTPTTHAPHAAAAST
jgi:pimeloyl-ACP methyl ester carboxylesterase